MNCLCSRTRQAARLLSRNFEDHLRLAGLTPAQFELLSNIHFRPNKSQTELAELLHTDQTTLSRNLRLLSQRKWIRATRSKLDRRLSGYQLTELGERVWADGQVHWKQADRQIRAALGDDWETAVAMIDRIIAAASK